MGEAPKTYTIEAVYEDGRVVLEGFNSPLHVSPQTTPISAGAELRGWLNPQGKRGPYFKVAEARSQPAQQPFRDEGRTDAIQRQHSQEMALRYMVAKNISEFTLDDDFRKVIDWFEKDIARSPK